MPARRILITALAATLTLSLGCTSPGQLGPVTPTPTSPTAPVGDNKLRLIEPIDTFASKLPATETEKRAAAAAYTALTDLVTFLDKSHAAEQELVAAAASDALAATTAPPEPMIAARPYTQEEPEAWTRVKRIEDKGDGTVTVTAYNLKRSMIENSDQTLTRTFAKSEPATTLTFTEHDTFGTDYLVGGTSTRDATRLPDGTSRETITLVKTLSGDPLLTTEVNRSVANENSTQGTITRLDGSTMTLNWTPTASGSTATITDQATGVTLTARFDAAGQLDQDDVQVTAGGRSLGRIDPEWWQ